jgi:hypothetical protein
MNRPLLLGAIFGALAVALVAAGQASAEDGGVYARTFPGRIRPPALSTAATILSGRPVTVVCDSPYGGHVIWRAEDPLPENIIHLNPDLCADLETFRRGGWPKDERRAAYALVALAHESAHASGVRDEVQADCRALVLLRQAGGLVGLVGDRLSRIVAIASIVTPYLRDPRACL